MGPEHRREEDGTDGEKGGYQYPGGRAGLVNGRQQRDHISSIQEQEEHDERGERRPERQAGDAVQHRGGKRDHLVGARLDQHESAGKAGQPEHRAVQPRACDGARGDCLPVRSRKGGHQ